MRSMFQKTAFLFIATILFTNSVHAISLKSIKKATSKAVENIPKPSANLKDVDITSISFTDINFLFTVTINNPYPININLDKVKCDFVLENSKIFSTETPSGFIVNANKDNDVNLNVVLTYQSIIDAAKSYYDNDHVKLNLNGEIVIAIPEHEKVKGAPSSITLPFSISKSIPTIKPVVAIKNLHFELPSDKAFTDAIAKSAKKSLNPANIRKGYSNYFSGKSEIRSDFDPSELDIVFKVSFDIELKNETKTALIFNSLDYDLSLNNQQILIGQATDIKTQNNNSKIHVTNEISSKNFGKSFTNALQERRANFNLKGNTFIKLPSEIKVDPLKLDFTVSGETKF